MLVQPVYSTSVDYTGKVMKTDKGNSYEKSNVGKATGLVAGLALAGGLMHSQIKSLKTISGKKNLIGSFHINGKSLNDVEPRVIIHNSEGRIVPPEGGVSQRTKKIVKEFKQTLAYWGAGITAITTGLGAIADTSITSVRAKEADLPQRKIFGKTIGASQRNQNPQGM